MHAVIRAFVLHRSTGSDDLAIARRRQQVNIGNAWLDRARIVGSYERTLAQSNSNTRIERGTANAIAYDSNITRTITIDGDPGNDILRERDVIAQDVETRRDAFPAF